MKYFFFSILYIFLVSNAFAQDDSVPNSPIEDTATVDEPTGQGFTRKSEALNELKDNTLDGRWLEYLDRYGEVTIDSTAPLYRLTVYKDGKPDEVRRTYLKNGTLQIETPYRNGMKNGVEKKYDKNGGIMWTGHYTSDKLNGAVVWYNKIGKVVSKALYSNDERVWITKEK